MSNSTVRRSRPRRRGLPSTALAVGLVLAVSACGSSNDTQAPVGGATTGATGAPAVNDKPLKLAYLPFTVANSYEAPMQAAAKKAAEMGNATLTVLSADNDPKKQFAQLQTALSSGQYDGIVVQPILATGLTTLVTDALDKGIKVVTMDQILGPDNTTADPQVPGLSASIVFVPTDIGTKLGKLTVDACASKQLDPCNVGFLYDLKASSLNVAIRESFDKAVSGSPVTVVGEGETFYTPSKALGAVQNLLQSQPDTSLIVGSDQGIQGAVQALSSAGKKDVLLVGYGGSDIGIKGVASGAWFGTVAQAPADEGRLAVTALIDAIRTGKETGGMDPSAALPDGGVVRMDNASKFTGQWPG